MRYFVIQHLPKNSKIPFYILKNKKDDYLDALTLMEKVKSAKKYES